MAKWGVILVTPNFLLNKMTLPLNGVIKMQINNLPETGYLRLPQVLKLFPVSRSSWWAGVKSGRYPKSVKIGPRTTAWRVEDIKGLISQPAIYQSPIVNFKAEAA